MNRNWWKVAFFVALFAFEAARETIVINAGQKSSASVVSSVFGSGGYVSARGMWARTGGGDSKLIPNAVTIECYASDSSCIEATTSDFGGSFMAPELDRFDATFVENMVTYKNENPECATYTVRIDLTLQTVTALRQRKENPANETCKMLEKRIESKLISSFDVPRENPTKGHFVPIYSFLFWIFDR